MKSLLCYKLALKTDDPLNFKSLSYFKSHSLFYALHVATYPILGKIFAFNSLDCALRMRDNMDRSFAQKVAVFECESVGNTYAGNYSLSSSVPMTRVLEFWNNIEKGRQNPTSALEFYHEFYYDAPCGTIYLDGVLLRKQIV